MIKSLDKWMVENGKIVCLITKKEEPVPTKIDGKNSIKRSTAMSMHSTVRMLN
jgi:hypothetical protein